MIPDIIDRGVAIGAKKEGDHNEIRTIWSNAGVDLGAFRIFSQSRRRIHKRYLK